MPRKRVFRAICNLSQGSQAIIVSLPKGNRLTMITIASR